MNTEKRIALACFIGAVIGALLALQFNHYFWWAGILLGGVTGYLSYEFKTVIQAVKSVWNEVCKEKDDDFMRVKRWMTMALTGLGLLARTIAGFGFVVLTGISWMLAMVLVNHGAPLFLADFYVEGQIRSAIGATLFITGASGAVIIFIWGEMTFLLSKGIQEDTPASKVCFQGFRDANAVSVVLYWLPFGLFKLVQAIPSIVRVVWCVASRTFILIHSEIRLLCMTDAMLGAFAGYLCGNALIGGVAGAILGVVNYKLVSVRWLKLARA